MSKGVASFRETTPFYALFAHFRASISTLPIFDPRSASGGITHLTFALPRADEIIQISPHRLLGQPSVCGNLFRRAIYADARAQLGADVVEGLPLCAFSCGFPDSVSEHGSFSIP